MHDIWNPWHGCVKCSDNKKTGAAYVRRFFVCAVYALML